MLTPPHCRAHAAIDDPSCMKQSILLVAIAILSCIAASMVPFRFIPIIVAISLGVVMMLHGLLSPRPTLDSDLGA